MAITMEATDVWWLPSGSDSPVRLTPFIAPAVRVPYEKLTDEEREAIHAWCRLHNIDPAATPIDPVIEYDAAIDEWRIQQFVQRDGRTVYDEARDLVATKFLRRVRKAELPWRRE